jgi:hypothetical protein
LPSLSAIDGDEIKISKPMAGAREANFVYLRVFSNDEPGRLYTFVRDSFVQIGFPKAVIEQDLTKFLIGNGLAQEFQTLNTLISLHRLSSITGPFVVAELSLVRVAADRFEFRAAIIDPVKAETVFSAVRSKVSWLNFDREFTYPMMNAIKQWFDESAKLPAPPSPVKRPAPTI